MFGMIICGATGYLLASNGVDIDGVIFWAAMLPVSLICACISVAIKQTK